jgi:hypothetical protein
MELRHFRYFAAVAQYLNYSEASRRLHVAQPAISQTILDLEEEIPAKLFLRSNRKVQLTARETARGTAPFVFKLRRLPATSMLAAVDIERFAGDEFRSLKIEDRINDVTDFSHATDRM